MAAPAAAPPHARTLRARRAAQGASFVPGSRAGALRALYKTCPPALASGPGAGHKGGTGAPARAHPPAAPGAPRGGDPADHKGPRRAPGAHLKRGESLMHSSNSTVMAAAARGAHWHEDRGAPSGIPCRPARPRRAAPRRARRPPAPERGRRATAPPRLSPPGSVAKVRRPRAPSAVTAGERRQSSPPALAASCHRRGASPNAPTSRPLRAGGRKCGWAQQQPREPSGPARSSDPAVRQPGGLATSVRPDCGGRMWGGEWPRERASLRGAVSPGSALCTRSLSLAPPPPPPWAAKRGCLGGAKAQAQARERLGGGGVTRLGARARAGAAPCAVPVRLALRGVRFRLALRLPRCRVRPGHGRGLSAGALPRVLPVFGHGL